MRLFFLMDKSLEKVPQDPFSQVDCPNTVSVSAKTQDPNRKRRGGKEIRTSQVLWEYTGWQHTFRRKSELVRIKFRIKSVLIKNHIQHAHGSVDAGPGDNKCFAIDTFAHNIESFTWTANMRFFPLGIARATPSTTAIVVPVVRIRREKNVLSGKLTNAQRPHDIPNCNHACRVDG
jgi:hypothetical protein